MTTLNLNTPEAKKMKKMTSAQLNSRAKKATGSELEMIKALIAERNAKKGIITPEVPAEAPAPASVVITKDVPAAEDFTDEVPSTDPEILELQKKIEIAKAGKKANEVKKLTQKLNVLMEEKEEKTPEAEEAPKAEKAPKTEKAPKAPKVVAETAITESKDKKIQARINALPKLIGQELKDELTALKALGIDVDFISFINKGDEVEFEAANNSPHKGKKLTGIVIGNTELDAKGRKYCRVRVEKFKTTFQKSQMAVTRIELPEVKK